MVAKLQKHPPPPHFHLRHNSHTHTNPRLAPHTHSKSLSRPLIEEADMEKREKGEIVVVEKEEEPKSDIVDLASDEDGENWWDEYIESGRRKGFNNDEDIGDEKRRSSGKRKRDPWLEADTQETLDATVGMVEKPLQPVDGGIEWFLLLDDLLVAEDLVVAQTKPPASHLAVAGSTMQTCRFSKNMDPPMKDNRCLNQLLK
ncbi:hypothetical protein Droror1_Dr00017600, partial [Drosera rotundifolia]